MGIDYYPGDGGKVEQLFIDIDPVGNVRRMDTFEPGWLSASLHQISGGDDHEIGLTRQRRSAGTITP